MLILPQKVTIKWNSKTKRYYVEKGYTFTKINDEFEVDIKDLTKGSSVEVECICDGCGKKLIKPYAFYWRDIKFEGETNGKTLCKKCCIVRKKQTCLKNLGVEYPTQSEKVKEKRKQTCLKRFGVEYPTQNEKIKKKVQRTREKNMVE